MIKHVEDIIKLFGMSNQIVEHDLDRIEEEFQVDLGRKPPRVEDKDTTYYPQFGERIRLDASRMAEHYEIFYCLEKSIREIVNDALTVDKGPNWWETGCVPNNIHAEVAKRIQREIDSAITLRSTNSIDFTTFGELGEIIKTNWHVFGSIFNSQKAVEKVMANLNTLRGPIAHCGLLAEDEVLRLQLSLRDWFRLME